MASADISFILLSLVSFVFAVLLTIFALVFRKRSDPLYNIPGPLLARWTPIWLAYHARRGRRFKAVHEAHQRYGPFVRVAPDHISIANADAIPIVYGQFGGRSLTKAPFYDAFVSDEPSVFSVRNTTSHAQKRRLMSHAFSVRSLGSIAPFIHSRMEPFAQKLDALCDSDEYVDTLKWFNYLAFDVISDLTFGESLGMLAKGSDVIEVQGPDGLPYEEHAIHLVDDREHLAAVTGVMPSLRLIANFLPDPFFRRTRKSNKGIRTMARQGVLNRIETGARREDILNKLIEARLEGGDGTLSAKQIAELTSEAVTILVAGTHTSASSMAAILHLLGTNNRVYKKLMTELDGAVGQGEIPTYDQIKCLPYLEATITEGLRFHTTNATGLPRCAPVGGVHCCGKYFPEGTVLSIPAWTVEHDVKVWGDPFSFRPERWLESPELRRYTLAFGAGPRVCLGRHIASMEMLFVLATFLLRYDFVLKSNTLETIERFQHEPTGMLVKLRRRRTAIAT